MQTGIIRDKKGNLLAIHCVVCGNDIGIRGAIVKKQPYCGKHYQRKVKGV